MEDMGNCGDLGQIELGQMGSGEPPADPPIIRVERPVDPKRLLIEVGKSLQLGRGEFLMGPQLRRGLDLLERLKMSKGRSVVDGLWTGAGTGRNDVGDMYRVAVAVTLFIYGIATAAT